MNDCAICEERLSALVDGELEPAATIETLDHAMNCASCRRFYLDARAVDRVLRPAGAIAAIPEPVLPPGAWERIERAGRRPEPATFREWGLRAAALVVVAIGLWSIGGLRGRRIADPPASYDISLEGEPATMTDARFVEMTTEILQADRRYHRAMYEVMRDVNATTGGVEGSEDELAVGSEDREPSREGESRLPS